MAHPLTKLAWLCVGGTIALAGIWTSNNAESDLQLTCSQADSRPRIYECADAHTGEVVSLHCSSVSAGRRSVGMPKKMNLRAIPPNCSEQAEEEATD
jgi:hypothetical protein